MKRGPGQKRRPSDGIGEGSVIVCLFRRCLGLKNLGSPLVTAIMECDRYAPVSHTRELSL